MLSRHRFETYVAIVRGCSVSTGQKTLLQGVSGREVATRMCRSAGRLVTLLLLCSEAIDSSNHGGQVKRRLSFAHKVSAYL